MAQSDDDGGAMRELYHFVCRGAVFCLLLPVLSVGCVTPPAPVPLPPEKGKELAVVSAATRAQESARAGRYGMSERDLRLLLHRGVVTPAIYSDLAFVLESENRLKEAELIAKRGLKQFPEEVSFSDTLARVYYRSGEWESAKEVLETLASQPAETFVPKRPRIGDKEVGRNDVLRNLSILLYMAGEEDEAVCVSQELFQKSGYSDQELMRHARLLLSIERTEQAAKLLGERVSREDVALQEGILFDYALALMSLGQKESASEALRRVKASPSVDYLTRRRIKLLEQAYRAQEGQKGDLAQEEEEDEEEEEGEEGQQEFEIDPCEVTAAEYQAYWPLAVVEVVEQFQADACDVDGADA